MQSSENVRVFSVSVLNVTEGLRDVQVSVVVRKCVSTNEQVEKKGRWNDSVKLHPYFKYPTILTEYTSQKGC